MTDEIPNLKSPGNDSTDKTSEFVSPVTLGQWGGYSNGQIPLAALSVVSYPGVVPDKFPGSLPQVYLEPHSAGALLAMLQAYHAQSSDFLQVNEGYRTLAGQQYWWDYYNHNSSLASPPGTSNHGWGQAFDFEPDSLNSTRLNWIHANAAKYGYTGISSENWHFNYTGSYIPPHPSSGEDNMSYSIVKDAQTPTIYACSLVTGRRIGIQNPYHVGLLQRYKVNNANDPMLVAELDIVASYLSQIGRPPG